MMRSAAVRSGHRPDLRREVATGVIAGVTIDFGIVALGITDALRVRRMTPRRRVADGPGTRDACEHDLDVRS
jgi:hypothetical protein